MAPFDQLLKLMLRPSVAVCYLGFVILSFLFFDKSIAIFFHDIDIKINLPVVFWLSKAGVGEFYVIAILLLALFFRYVRPNKTWEIRSWFLWVCVTIPYGLCGILKVLLGRARPQMLFDSQIYGFHGFSLSHDYWSCPSGHTSTIMGLAFGLIILFPRYVYAFLAAGLLVVATRVLLTNHYFSDVMFTCYLTLMEVGLILFVLRSKAWLLPGCNIRGGYEQVK